MAGVGVTRDRVAPTLEDVARAAGVSRATVSRVVNGGRLVAAETVREVSRVIAELGYRPNSAARALVTRRVGAVAVVVPEADELVFTDPFFPQAYHGAIAAFAEHEIQVLLAMAQPGESAHRMVRYLQSGHVDGAIVISHHGPELAKELREASIPVVFVGDPGVKGVAFAELDQHDAARRATEYLMARGSTRIASITGPMDMNAGIERLRGFRAAMDAAGLEPVGIAEGGFSLSSGERAMARLLAVAPDLDGIFVASDLMAAGALRALHAAGLEVPGQVRVIGFDNSTAGRQAEPRLTTMTNPASELTRMAGEMLLQILSGQEPQAPRILTSDLIVRESA